MKIGAEGNDTNVGVATHVLDAPSHSLFPPLHADAVMPAVHDPPSQHAPVTGTASNTSEYPAALGVATALVIPMSTYAVVFAGTVYESPSGSEHATGVRFPHVPVNIPSTELFELSCPTPKIIASAPVVYEYHTPNRVTGAASDGVAPLHDTSTSSRAAIAFGTVTAVGNVVSAIAPAHASFTGGAPHTAALHVVVGSPRYVAPPIAPHTVRVTLVHVAPLQHALVDAANATLIEYTTCGCVVAALWSP
jgi:hypothetical protein